MTAESDTIYGPLPRAVRLRPLRRPQHLLQGHQRPVVEHHVRQRRRSPHPPPPRHRPPSNSTKTATSAPRSHQKSTPPRPTPPPSIPWNRSVAPSEKRSTITKPAVSANSSAGYRARHNPQPHPPTTTLPNPKRKREPKATAQTPKPPPTRAATGIRTDSHAFNGQFAPACRFMYA